MDSRGQGQGGAMQGRAADRSGCGPARDGTVHDAMPVGDAGRLPVPGRWSWHCLGGWGTALVVLLVAAPAVWDYWSLVNGGCHAAPLLDPGEKGPVVTLSVPPRPAEHGVLAESLPTAEPVQWGAPMQSLTPIRVAEAVQRLDTAKEEVMLVAEAVQRPEPVMESAPEPATGPQPVLEPIKMAEPVQSPEEGQAGGAAPVAEVGQSGQPVAPPAGSAGSAAPVDERTAVVPGRSAQAEKGLDSMYHAGKKPSPIPLDFKFTIQVGSFREREGALTRASELRYKGYDAYILEAQGKKDPHHLWRSVRIGRFQDRETAQSALEIYRRKEHDTAAFIAINDSFSEGGHGKDARSGPAAESSLLILPSAGPVRETVAPSRPPPVKETTATPSMPPLPVKESPAPPALPPQPAVTVPETPVKGIAQGADRDDAAHLFQQSLAFRNNRDVAQEEVALRQTLQKDASHGLARNRLARILVEGNRAEEGLQVLQDAVRGRSVAVLAADDPNLAAFLAALYQRQAFHAQAAELYQALLQRQPDKGIWRMGLAISLEKMGKTQQALTAYQASLADSTLSAKLRSFVQTRVDQLQQGMAHGTNDGG
ncbi:MAG: SPOR domain-containing protein [Magnetococcus sp. DMHC-8]